MFANPQRQVLAACLVLSAMLHWLGALLFQPMPIVPGPVAAAPQFTVFMSARESKLTQTQETAAPPQASLPFLTPATAIPLEVPKSVVLEVDPLKFYSGQEVDFRSEPATEVNLLLPKVPAGGPASARLVLELKIDEAGQVVDVKVVESTHPGLFDAHAIDSFRKVAFLPARLHGVAVKSTKRIEVGYENLQDKGASKTR